MFALRWVGVALALAPIASFAEDCEADRDCPGVSVCRQGTCTSSGKAEPAPPPPIVAPSRPLTLSENPSAVTGPVARIGDLRLPPNTVPEEAQTSAQKGVSLYGMGRLDDATAAFLDVERRAPSWVAVQLNLALIAERQGKWDEAATRFKRYFAQAPDEEKTALRMRIVDAEIKRDDKKKASLAPQGLEGEVSKSGLPGRKKVVIKNKSGRDWLKCDVRLPDGTHYFIGDLKQGEEESVMTFRFDAADPPLPPSEGATVVCENGVGNFPL